MIILGRYYMKLIGILKFVHVPPQLTGVSTLPGETGNREIVSFYLNGVCYFVNILMITSKYHLVIVKHPFTVKTTI